MTHDWNDPSWHTVSDVPILDEHEVVDKDGNVIDRVDLKRLRRIAAVNNRKTAGNNPSPIILGHTSDDPASQEKPVNGYMVNYRIKPYKDHDGVRNAIYVDYKLFPEHKGIEKQYPRRSVEWWTDTDEIDPLALLGGTTPERHLGAVIRKSATGDKRRYSITDYEEPPMSTPQRPTYRPGNGAARRRYAADGEEDQDAIADRGGEDGGANEDPHVAALMESKPYKELCGKVDRILSMLEGAAGGQDGGMDGMPEDDGLQPDHEDHMDHAEHPPVRMGASGYGSGTDGFIPDMGHEGRRYAADEHLPDEHDEGYTEMRTTRRMSRQAVTEVNRLRAETQAAKKEAADTRKLLAKVVRKLSRAEAEKTIAALAAEGYVFADPKQEVEFLASLDEEGQQFQVESVIKKNYQRRAKDIASRPGLAQYARMAPPEGSTDTGPDEPVTPEEAQELAQIMIRDKLSRADALKKFRRPGQPRRT